MKSGNLFKNLLLLGISIVFSLLIFELVARKYLNLSGNYWSETSDWTKEYWLENHEHGNLTTDYTMDVYDSLYGWTLKANLHRLRYGDWEVSSNAQGCRGVKDYPYQKTGKLRIITIGDSFTFGECARDSDNYPAVLESLLGDAEVINLAVHGYGQDQQLLKLMYEGVKYRPDIVLLGFVNDDLRRNKLSFRDYAKPYFMPENDTLKLQGVPVPAPAFFLKAFRWKSRGLIKAKWAALLERKNDTGNDVVSKRILYKMYEQCRSMNAHLVLVYLPYQAECTGNQSARNPLFDSLAAMPGVWSVDPTTAIHQAIAKDKDPKSNFNCHYSPIVNRTIAKEISVAINKMNRGAVH